MLSDNEAIRQLCADFPQVYAVEGIPDEKMACSLFYSFSAYANDLIAQEDWGRFGECLTWTSNLYGSSSDRLKTFIENIFLYKIGDQAQLSQHRGRLMELMPEELKHLLQRQFIASNI